MLERANKHTGQVIIETVIVLIVLAVVAIGAITLFSNLNTQMLDRLGIFRRTRLRALNNPNAAGAAPVAPSTAWPSRRRPITRPLSNPTTFLDYLPVSAVSITPDVPSGFFTWDDMETDDPVSYELQLIMGLAVRYKMNQANWLAQRVGLDAATGRYLPNNNYVYLPRRLIGECRSSRLLGRARSLLHTLITQYETDPAIIAAADASIRDAFNAVNVELINITRDIGRTRYDRFTRTYYLTGPPDEEHYRAINLTDMIVGNTSYTVASYEIDPVTFEPTTDPPTMTSEEAENPLITFYPDVLTECPECFSKAITNPFFNSSIRSVLLNVAMQTGGDLTMRRCTYVKSELEKIKDDPSLGGEPYFKKILMRLYNRLDFLLTNYTDRKAWISPDAVKARSICRIEGRYLYYASQQAPP